MTIKDTVQYTTPQLTLQQANNLAEMPLTCVNQEYPNKLSQTIGNAGDLKEPSVLHPAFYGCFDWHSAVHGHWSMVYLLKTFPDLAKADTLKIYLKMTPRSAGRRREADINDFLNKFLNQ